MKTWMMILFVMNSIVALINYFAGDMLNAIWFLVLANITLILYLKSEVADSEID